MHLSAMAAKIAPIIEPSLEAMGYDLVRVHWTEGSNRTLQIMAERKDGKEINVDDCAEISHTVSALLDVEDPIEGAYRLEVSSPGIDRPLTKMEHFAAHIGDEVKIEMAIPQQGRKRFRGVIVAVENMNSQPSEARRAAGGSVALGACPQPIVRLKVDNMECVLPYADMASAKLVLTDELVKRAMKKQENEIT